MCWQSVPWSTVLEHELPVALSSYIELTVTSQNIDDIHESKTDHSQALNLYEQQESCWLTTQFQHCHFSNSDSKVTNEDIRCTDTYITFQKWFPIYYAQTMLQFKNAASVIPLEMINQADQFIHIHMGLWTWLFHYKLSRFLRQN